ncbi:MAG: hypothetical protein V7K68_24170 [Nostoc sp.]
MEALGILTKIHENVLVILRTLEDRDRQKNTNIGLAIFKKIIEVLGGRIT